MTIRRIAIVAALAVFGGACGGAPVEQEAAGPASSRPPSTLPTAEVSGGSPTFTAQEARSNEIPDAVVRDVANGAEINIRSLAPAPEPLFFWFYAPH